MSKIFAFLKKKWKMAAVIVALLFVVFLIFNPAKKKPVKTVKPVEEAIKQTLSLSGSVDADNHAVLTFQTGGRLSYLKVKVGDKIKKGELLASLDTSDLKTAVIVANNNWLSADAVAKNAEDIVKDHASDETFVQKQTRVTAQTARDAAYFKWQQAQADLRDAYLIAPFDGIVAAVNGLQVNSNISVSGGSIEVADPSTLYFSAELDETDLSKTAAGQKVTVTLDAYQGESFESTIESIDFAPKSNVTGTVYRVVMRLPKDALSKFKLGLNGTADILIKEKDKALVIPIDALTNINGDTAKTKILKNGKQETVDVGVGIMNDTNAEITKGLSTSDLVVMP